MNLFLVAYHPLFFFGWA